LKAKGAEFDTKKVWFQIFQTEWANEIFVSRAETQILKSSERLLTLIL
jgi:hypothetical protein